MKIKRWLNEWRERKDGYIYRISKDVLTEDGVSKTEAINLFKDGQITGIYPIESFKAYPQE